MRKTLFVFALLMTAFSLNAKSSWVTASYDVVPMPAKVTTTAGGSFVLSRQTAIVVTQNDEALLRDARFLKDYIFESTGIGLNIVNKKTANAISLVLDPTVSGDEAYQISIGKQGVVVRGSTPQGVFYGVQTLRKSIPAVTTVDEVVMPAVAIADAPRFAWRGMMLDCSRHFFDVAFVKRYIDLLALHNMNTFHWHLSDDQGWRIEIKKHPRLTEVGSVRESTVVGRNSHVYDGVPHGGYYTQEQVKEIVAYAADRYINVVPEIDMPGHMMAALTAYPDMGCTGGPYKVGRRWGVLIDVLCLGNEKTYSFCEDVLSEIIDLFPSKYIHIGGDEAPNERWTVCPKCKKVMAEHNLTPKTIQGYFTNRMEKFVNSKGRSIIGWDEILDGEINASATIQSWRGAETGIKAAKQGHDVVMSPTSHCYFDYQQTDKTWGEATLCGGNISVEKVYNFDPLAGVPEENVPHILGVQANLWTEYVAYPQQAEYQVLPRMAALAEVQWSTTKPDYDTFVERMPRLLDYYDLYRYNYATHLWGKRRPQVEGFNPAGD